MKKTLLLSLISTLSCSTLSYAGGMGGDSSFCCSAFVSLEGGYTWNMIHGYDFTFSGSNASISSLEDNQGYTGRLGGGMTSMIDDEFGVTGELGWGYYGKTDLNPSFNGVVVNIPGVISQSHTITGFDALIGVAYVQPSFNVSLKVGAMMQNLQNKFEAAFAPGVFPLFDSYYSKTNRTQVLPEIKLGGAYSFDNNWAITAAYLLVVGSKPNFNADFNVNTGSFNYASNSQNPGLNTFLLGVQYSFG